jgi:hypothetical protein
LASSTALAASSDSRYFSSSSRTTLRSSFLARSCVYNVWWWSRTPLRLSCASSYCARERRPRTTAISMRGRSTTQQPSTRVVHDAAWTSMAERGAAAPGEARRRRVKPGGGGRSDALRPRRRTAGRRARTALLAGRRSAVGAALGCDGVCPSACLSDHRLVGGEALDLLHHLLVVLDRERCGLLLVLERFDAHVDLGDGEEGELRLEALRQVLP